MTLRLPRELRSLLLLQRLRRRMPPFQSPGTLRPRRQRVTILLRLPPSTVRPRPLGTLPLRVTLPLQLTPRLPLSLSPTLSLPPTRRLRLRLLLLRTLRRRWPATPPRL
jgi:hypothetical protein